MVGENALGAAETIPAPGLLILTGASHTGKTAVAQALVKKLQGRAAFLAVDEILERVLPVFDGDIWQQIPLAYELIAAQLPILLARGWLVIVESTFTYVPPDEPPELHRTEMERLLEQAESCHAPSLLVQLVADEEVALSRARTTGRLDPEVVAGTFAAHASTPLLGSSLRIDTALLDPDASASTILRSLATPTRDS
jgi:hypothetical protein